VAKPVLLLTFISLTLFSTCTYTFHHMNKQHSTSKPPTPPHEIASSEPNSIMLIICRCRYGLCFPFSIELSLSLSHLQKKEKKPGPLSCPSGQIERATQPFAQQPGHIWDNIAHWHNFHNCKTRGLRQPFS
jgi:hypothetical protein